MRISNDIVLGILLVAVVASAAFLRYSSSPKFYVANPEFEIEAVEDGVTNFHLEIVNKSSSDITVSAIDRNCACAILEPTPILVAGGSRQLIAVSIDCTKAELPMRENFRLFTDPPVTGVNASVLIK